MEIGKLKRSYTIEPIEDPVPAAPPEPAVTGFSCGDEATRPRSSRRDRDRPWARLHRAGLRRARARLASLVRRRGRQRDSPLEHHPQDALARHGRRSSRPAGGCACRSSRAASTRRRRPSAAAGSTRRRPRAPPVPGGRSPPGPTSSASCPCSAGPRSGASSTSRSTAGEPRSRTRRSSSSRRRRCGPRGPSASSRARGATGCPVRAVGGRDGRRRARRGRRARRARRVGPASTVIRRALPAPPAAASAA